MKEYYILRYREYNPERSGILDLRGGQYAGYNPDLNGCPYPTKQFFNAKIWGSLDEAKFYQSKHQELKIYKVIIKLEQV